MPYYSELDVLDVWGLCSKEIAAIKYDAARAVISEGEADEQIREIFFDYDADYVALDVVGQSYDEARELAESGNYTLLNAHPQFRNINKDLRFVNEYYFIEAYPAMPEYSILLFKKNGA